MTAGRAELGGWMGLAITSFACSSAAASHDESVFSISSSLASQFRAPRGRKKNDIIDAENVAQRCW